MAEFKFVKNIDGGEEQYEELLMADDSIAAGEVLYYSSGYVSNETVGNITCQTVVGVAGEAIDNSGGSDGSYSIAVLVSPNAVYEATTTSTVTQALMGTNVTLDSTTVVDENDNQDDYTGVIHLISMISTSKVFCRINHYSPRA